MFQQAFQRLITFFPLLLCLQLGVQGQVVINEVYPDNGVVELKNLGTSNVDVSSYWICNFPSYYELQGQTILCGNLNLAPGDILAVQLINNSLSNADGETGLYTRRAFGDTAAIIDYVEWGFAGHQRASVAIAAGIWAANDFAPAIGAGQSLAYDGSGDAASNFALSTPTICTENKAIRLFTIDTNNETVTLKNVGPFPEDISGYNFCLGPGRYNVLSNYTTIIGSLNLAPNASVEIDLTSGSLGVTNLPDTAGLGLFINPVFGSSSPNDLGDYVQWKAGNQPRVGQAVTAGRWDAANDFVGGASPYQFQGDANDIGSSFWNGSVAPARVRIVKIDTDNEVVILKNFGGTTEDISGYNFCLGPGRYNVLSNYTALIGSLNLAPNASVEIDLTSGSLGVTNLPDTAGLGLFINPAFGSTSPNDLGDYVQWKAGNQPRVGQAVTAGRWDAANNFVSGASPYQFQGDANDIGSSFWNGSAAPARVRFLLIDPDNEEIVLKNFGSATEDISGYNFCLGPGRYNVLSNYTHITGSLNLGPNETVTIDLTSGSLGVTALPDTGGIGLFINPVFGSNSPDDLGDYVQWKAGNQLRVIQAVAAGRWTDVQDFAPGNGPYSFVGDGDDIGPRFWIDNTIVRMSQIVPEIDWVTIKNFDDAPREISNYFFCTQTGVYPRLGDTTQVRIVNGDLYLSPGEEVTVKVLTVGGVLDTGSIFLFSSNVLGFNNQNSAVTRDFAQWQIANGFRAGNAVAAGRWDDAAAFIQGDSPFDYIGGRDDVGASFWKGVEACPAQAGTLTADADTFFIDGGDVFAAATPDGNAVVPAGFTVRYILTAGKQNTIKQISSRSVFRIRRPGTFFVHTLILDTNPGSGSVNLKSFIAAPLNSLSSALTSSGVCHALDQAGETIIIDNGPPILCDAIAGTLSVQDDTLQLMAGEAFIQPIADGNAVIPAGSTFVEILTSNDGVNDIILQIGPAPFRVTQAGTYRVHAFVFDANTYDPNSINLGAANSNTKTLAGFILNRDLCANVDREGTQVVVLPHAVNRVSLGDQLTIYPNPTSSKLTISMESAQLVAYQLIDFAGRVVSRGNWTFESGEAQLDLSNHQSGIYQLMLQDLETGERYVERIIKQ